MSEKLFYTEKNLSIFPPPPTWRLSFPSEGPFILILADLPLILILAVHTVLSPSDLAKHRFFHGMLKDLFISSLSIQIFIPKCRFTRSFIQICLKIEWQVCFSSFRFLPLKIWQHTPTDQKKIIKK